MHERDHDRRRERDQTRSPEPLPPPRSSADAVLALQRAIGNHGTARVLAREDKNRPSFPHSVKIGTLGPIEIKGGNIEDWVAKKDPDDLKVISDEGKHSKELKHLFESKTQFDRMETSSVVGENTLVTITFTGCRIKRYSADGGTEDWVVEYKTAKRTTLSIGAAR